MSVDLPGKAKEIFLAAVEIEAAEQREAFLKGACMGDDSLTARVQELLRAHESPESLLDHSAPRLDEPAACEVTIEHADGERLGSRIGPYILREQIGEGGMGTVYVAEQEKPLRRKVALKVIKPGMDTKAVIARFEAERQALAVMDHPNIAKVLDAGTTPQGRPYFVMELVRGIAITEYCDIHKLTIPQRLELFTHVCQAIQHSHQKGIIHRDIKPSNVLVTEQDGKAIPKVIDFGVAKAVGQRLTERTIYTSFQAVIGTPLYMSPEQASLSNVDVDTRSDVYSLGVLLYELLTGTTPLILAELKQAAQEEVMKRIREHEPPRPSSRVSTMGAASTRISHCRKTQPEHLNRIIRGDLDWIVMKALEKDRSRRYGTPNSLAEDVLRYLNHDAVTASPPSPLYRFRKFAARNKAAVLIVTLFALGSVVTSTAGTYALIAQWKLTATLGELRDLLVDKGIQLSMAGDADGLEKLSTQATIVNVPDDWMLTLKASALYHRGDDESALKVLTNAKSSNISAKALHAVLSIEVRGDWIEFERRSVDLLRDQQSSNYIEDFDALFLAYAFVGYGIEGSKELEPILRRNPSWMMAKAVRANERASQFAVVGDTGNLKSALLEIESLIALYPQNRFLELRHLLSLNHALDFARRNDPELFTELKHTAIRVAKRLENYAPAYWPIASTFDLVGDRPNAILAFRKAAATGRSHVSTFDAVGYYYREGLMEDAWKVIENADPARPETKIAKAYLLLDEPGKKKEALDLYMSLRTDSYYDTWWIRTLGCKIPLLLGELEQVERDCQRWMGSARDDDAVHNADKLDKDSIHYLAKKDRAPKEYLDADTSVAGQFYASFTLGCESFAQGNREEAIAHFERCVKNSRIWQVEANWGRAFRNRIEDREWPRAREP